MYDNIVSLGYNCEVSFRIEDYFGSLNAMPFSWSYTLDRDRFAGAIRAPKEIFSEGMRVNDDHMLVCNRFELKFHPRYSILPQYGDYTQEQADEAYEELCGRIGHLTDKFVKLCAGDESTLFVMKVEDKGTEDNIKYIESVLAALTDVYRSGKFMLVAVPEKQAMNDELKKLENEHLKVFSVTKFAPRKHTNTMGDIAGWERIFRTMSGAGSASYRKNVRARRIEWVIDTVCRKLHINREHKEKK